MVTPGRDVVIGNIRRCVAAEDWNAKVEVGDPELSAEEKLAIVRKWLTDRRSLAYGVHNLAARVMARAVTFYENRTTEIIGLENLKAVKGGAIVTSNHFNPMDNTAVRKAVVKAHRRMSVVIQESNLAMTGLFGFYMKYTDTIPITNDHSYLKNDFYPLLEELMRKRRLVMIYPEQEMWFNYIKPRPPKRGAYYYAAELGVPIVSCFVEIRATEEKETEDFYKVRYIVHVLPAVYPDPSKSVRENSIAMMNKDYEQKKAAYERAYGRELTYEFSEDDIAGWTGSR